MGRKEAKRRSISHWGIENLKDLSIAYMMAMIIKCFCIDVYQIPTSSMEPTLLGNQDVHDKVMVTKFFYEFSSVNRFDVVVFKFPLNYSKNFIKRVVGMPGEEFFVYRGDIYFRKGSGPFKVAKKPPALQDYIWIDQDGIEDFLQDEQLLEQYWSVEGEGSSQVGEEGLCLRPEGDKKLWLRYRDPLLAEIDQDAHHITDLRIAMYIKPLSEEGYYFVRILNSYGRFLLKVGPKYPGRLLYLRPGRTRAQFEFGLRLRLNQWHHLQLAVIDGTFYVIIDGKVAEQFDIFRVFSEREEYDQRECKVRFGVKGLKAVIQRIQLGRDIYYDVHTHGSEVSNMQEGVPIKIPQDCYVVMGDNVGNSHDSRKWRRVRFLLKGGKEIVCERAEINREGHDPTYDYNISADKYGTPHSFNHEELDRRIEDPHPFVHRRYLIGRAFMVIWLPFSRSRPFFQSFRLIR